MNNANQPPTWTAERGYIFRSSIAQGFIGADGGKVAQRLAACAQLLAPHPDLDAVCVMRREDVEMIRRRLHILERCCDSEDDAKDCREIIAILPADGKEP